MEGRGMKRCACTRCRCGTWVLDAEPPLCGYCEVGIHTIRGTEVKR